MKHVTAEDFVIVGPITNVLLIGKQRIQNGWCKHKLYDRTTNSYCASGALMNINANAALRYLAKALSLLHPDFRTIHEFNDDPKTTLQQILNLYDFAITAVRRDGV